MAFPPGGMVPKASASWMSFFLGPCNPGLLLGFPRGIDHGRIFNCLQNSAMLMNCSTNSCKHQTIDLFACPIHRCKRQTINPSLQTRGIEVYQRRNQKVCWENRWPMRSKAKFDRSFSSPSERSLSLFYTFNRGQISFCHFNGLCKLSCVALSLSWKKVPLGTAHVVTTEFIPLPIPGSSVPKTLFRIMLQIWDCSGWNLNQQTIDLLNIPSQWQFIRTSCPRKCAAIIQHKTLLIKTLKTFIIFTP